MKIVFSFLLIFLSLCAEELSFSDDKTVDTTPIHMIQLFSTNSLEDAKKLLKKVPTELKDETNLYKVGSYFKGRYFKNIPQNELQPFLSTLRETGFPDAYILQSTLSSMQEELIENQNSNINIATNNQPIMNSISKFSKSNIIQKAESAYKRGDESEAILYYEMLLSSGQATEKIKNNLCYLYGKKGAWFNAKTLIDKEYYQINFLYAYAYGSVETHQETYYDNLSPYIMIDKSGMLMLLSGSYFEQKNDFPHAYTFYKMAYDINPTNPYLIFAYARSADLQNELSRAKQLYEDTLKKIDNSHPLYEPTTARVVQIKG